jgi:peptidoglycan/xylan/chitin deacetylase (PgdA/CDA1 family)
MSRALILTYHAVERGSSPLCIEPARLAQHLDCIVASRRRVVTVGALAEAVREDGLPDGAVAITFDDAFASVALEAAPLVAERGLVATVFAVAGHLGGWSDWPSQPSRAPRLPLAGADELAELARRGWEIGSHGFDHVALDGAQPPTIHRELADSRRLLECAVQAPVRAFAYPYGVVPDGSRALLQEAGYAVACTTRLAPVADGADVFALPRVDAHYLRRPSLLQAVLAGKLDVYLRARAVGARARRLVRKDYASPDR